MRQQARCHMHSRCELMSILSKAFSRETEAELLHCSLSRGRQIQKISVHSAVSANGTGRQQMPANVRQSCRLQTANYYSHGVRVPDECAYQLLWYGNPFCYTRIKQLRYGNKDTFGLGDLHLKLCLNASCV